MSPLQSWLGKKVHLTCRPATPDEVEHARRHDEEEERESHHDTQEDRIIRMMEDIHRLATNPSGEALRIQTFSGTVPHQRMKLHLLSGSMMSEKLKPDSLIQL